MPKNPAIADLTDNFRGRAYNLGDIEPVLVDGKKHCVWCLEPLTGKKLKWCSDKACIDSALAWARPQKEWGLGILLSRQGYKCAECTYDWTPIWTTLIGRVGIPKALDPLTQLNVRFVKCVKNRCPKDRRIEVDHLIAISLGGASIGLENHRAICHTCHKTKTKADAKERAKRRKDGSQGKKEE